MRKLRNRVRMRIIGRLRVRLGRVTMHSATWDGRELHSQSCLGNLTTTFLTIVVIGGRVAGCLSGGLRCDDFGSITFFVCQRTREKYLGALWALCGGPPEETKQLTSKVMPEETKHPNPPSMRRKSNAKLEKRPVRRGWLVQRGRNSQIPDNPWWRLDSINSNDEERNREEKAKHDTNKLYSKLRHDNERKRVGPTLSW